MTGLLGLLVVTILIVGGGLFVYSHLKSETSNFAKGRENKRLWGFIGRVESLAFELALDESVPNQYRRKASKIADEIRQFKERV